MAHALHTSGIERDGDAARVIRESQEHEEDQMSGSNRERPGEAPGPIDRALDRDRDDRMDLLEGAGGRTTGEQGEARVPVAEERLNVDKRQAELGEVQLRKTVEQEQVSVPVELEREEVRVDRRDVDDRPVQEGDQLFQEGTLRVPVRGEVAEVNKEAVVTGEVVVGKERTTERQDVSDTVRRERVEVDQDYDQHRSGFQQHFGQRQQQAGSQWGSRSWEDAEPNYQYGYMAGRNNQYQGRQWEDVESDLRSDYERRYGRNWSETDAGATSGAGALRDTGDQGPLASTGTRDTSTGSGAGTGTSGWSETDAGATSAGTGGGTGTGAGGRSDSGQDRWQQLREEIREGWNRARGS